MAIAMVACAASRRVKRSRCFPCVTLPEAPARARTHTLLAPCPTAPSRLPPYTQVQGVFFRKHTHKEAESLGLVGWVMNTESGTVVGEAQGPADKVQEM